MPRARLLRSLGRGWMLARLGQGPGALQADSRSRWQRLSGGETGWGDGLSGMLLVREGWALSCLFTGAELRGMMEPPSWISRRDPEATDRGCPTQGEGCREVGGLSRVGG